MASRELIAVYLGTLSTPIDVELGFPENSNGKCIFNMDGFLIEVLPRKYSDVVADEGDILEYPRLTEIGVRITDSRGIIEVDGGGIGLESERKIERIFVKAAQRVAKAVKLRTRQSNINTNRPIEKYAVEYILGGKVIDSYSARRPDRWRMPEDSEGRWDWGWDDIHDNLDSDKWVDVLQSVQTEVIFPPYEELIYAAINFQAGMQYEAAALYAGIAVEDLLNRVTYETLRSNHDLSTDQCKAILNGRSKPQIAGILRTMNAFSSDVHEDITSTLVLRNELAHGDHLNVVHQRSSKAIRVAKILRDKLSELTSSGTEVNEL